MNLEVTDESVPEGRVALRRKGDLLSYGNRIDVNIKSIEPNKSTVRVSSRSSASIQLFDWGTNEKLESGLLEIMKEILSE